MYLGFVEQEMQRTAAARACYDEALQLARALGQPRLEGLAYLYQGGLAAAEPDASAARAQFADARRVLEAIGDRRYAAVAAACEAIAAAAEGDLAASSAAISAAEPVLARPAERFAAALAIARAACALATRRMAGSAAAREGRDVEQLALQPPPRTALPAPILLRALSSMALRLFETNRDREATLPTPATSTAGVLRVARDGRWFAAPSGAQADLSRRRAHRLILARLAEWRLSNPDSGLSWDELSNTGWPAQRLAVEAAFGRVRTTIYELRRAGLEGLLLTRDDGYLLSPRTELERADAPALSTTWFAIGVASFASACSSVQAPGRAQPDGAGNGARDAQHDSVAKDARPVPSDASVAIEAIPARHCGPPTTATPGWGGYSDVWFATSDGSQVWQVTIVTARRERSDSGEAETSCGHV
jgi:hypothetical protein